MTTSALLTDLYELTMLQAYAAHGMADTAVFEVFVRHLPPTRGFLLAAGLEQVLHDLESLRFAPDEIAWLREAAREATRRTPVTMNRISAPVRAHLAAYCDRRLCRSIADSFDAVSLQSS